MLPVIFRIWLNSKNHNCIAKRFCQFATRLSNAEVRQHRSELFSQEQDRQKALIARIEKIEVHYKGIPEDVTLIMNKNMSTPFNCAQHMTEMLMQQSSLAEVNGQVWDMNRPLEEECTLKLLRFHDADPYHVNKAFWRSCSFMLGAVAENAFRDEFYVELHSFPPPNVKSGSFIYDVDLKMENWQPTKEELRTLSALMIKLAQKQLKFERLDISSSLALKMFADNGYKKEQISDIAAKSPSGNTVTVYRLGDHVDISRGPMITDTSFLGGRCSVPAVHRMETNHGVLYRFQGVALPKGILLNHYAWGLLEERAKKLNQSRIPDTASSTHEESSEAYNTSSVEP